MTDTLLKIAVFVDFDNIEIGVKTTLNQQFDIAAILEAIKERGEVVTKIAYGDWKRAGDYGRLLSQHAIRMVQRNLTPGGDKNGADINLALDALEMAFTHHHINAFVIVGGDSDFITLVEKLKQYDKKVFVVGGRQFTSLVMQKNCHEFIAYENLVGGRRPAAVGRRADAAPGGAADIAKAIPLVKRALKVLVDREVSPQLGLMKSTLLQLDSAFSERDYGASTFRDFMEKVARTGVVTLRHAGRSVLVDLAEGVSTEPGSAGNGTAPDAPATPATNDAREPVAAAPAAVDPAVEQQAVRQIRSLMRQASQAPRWPMYVRQLKQYLRGLDEGFDEHKLGFPSTMEFLRACQREGLLRLERDRKGVLRVFPGARPEPVAGSTVADRPFVDELAQPAALDLVEGDLSVEEDAVSLATDEPVLAPPDIDEAEAGEDALQAEAEDSSQPARPARARRSRKAPAAAKTARKPRSTGTRKRREPA